MRYLVGYGAAARRPGQSSGPPRMATYSVPGGSTAAHPCLTRDMQAHVTPGQVYDRFGCRVDPVSGWRIPEDCHTSLRYRPELRQLCLGVSRNIQTDTSERLAEFASGVAQAAPTVLSVLGPIMGPALSEITAEASAMVTRVIGKGDTLTKELVAFLELVKVGAENAIAMVEAELRRLGLAPLAAEAGETMKTTFARLASSSKTVTDFLENPQDAATKLVAYTGARSGIAVVGKMLEGHLPTLALVRDLSVSSMFGVQGLSSWARAIDAKKSLALLTSSFDAAKAEVGDLTPIKIDALLASGMPSAVAGDPRSILARLDMPSAGDPGVTAARKVAEDFAGKGVRAASLFDAKKLSNLVLDRAKARIFEAELSITARFERLVGPVANEAKRKFETARQTAGAITGVVQNRAEAEAAERVERALGIRAWPLFERQAYARRLLETAAIDADYTIAVAAARARGLEVTEPFEAG